VSFPQPQPFAGPPASGTTVVLNGPSSITVPSNRLGMDPGSIPQAVAGVPWVGPPPNFPGGPNPAATGVWTIQELLGGTGSSQAGDDLLLNNVISFDVKVLQEGYPSSGGLPFFVDLPHAALGNNTVFQPPNYVTANPPRNGVSVFDTWTKNYTGWATSGTTTSMPLKLRILALQITLRVWDERTQQTRQVTFIQEM
jgi:hypothetical protein